MRILLVEDHTQLANPMARELEDEHGHTVAIAHDPIEARHLLKRRERFDVAIIDLLFGPLMESFDRQRAAHQIVLTRDELLITGLSAVVDFRRARPNGGVVLWSSAEANRRLHLLFAYEELGVRAFCSKSSGTGKADVLNRAAIAAAEGREAIDPVIEAYLPPNGSPALRDTILRDQAKRAIWRALALHAYSRQEIRSITGYAEKTIANLIPAMRADLMTFDPGWRPAKQPLLDVSRYAGDNWQFFLDQALLEQYN